MVPIRIVNCPPEKISKKCPFSMKPNRIVIHNTANDAAAANEIAYMHRNEQEKSFHFAVDDVEIVQGIALDRNAWHAGDGNGKGNREGIAIEICYSKSGGERWQKSVENAAELTAKLLKDYGWGLESVTKHQDYSGKRCPHRILDEFGWETFLALVQKNLGTAPQPTAPSAPSAKTVEELAREVIAGTWGNGAERKSRLSAAGYDAAAVQKRVNELLSAAPKTPTVPAKKDDKTLAREIIRGDWGNGAERKQKLKAAGYTDADIAHVQKLVNSLLK